MGGNQQGDRMNIILEDGKLVECPKCEKPMDITRERQGMVSLECRQCKMETHLVMLGGASEEIKC